MTILVTYQHFEIVPIFPLDTHSPNRFSQFLSYLKVVLLSYVKTGGHLLPSFEKKLRVWQPLGKSHSQSSTTPSTLASQTQPTPAPCVILKAIRTRSGLRDYRPFLLFLDSDVSEKVWPQQLPLNRKGCTLMSCLALLLHMVGAQM